MRPLFVDRLVEQLLGKSVAGWEIQKLRGHGKSAVVFEAKRGSESCALKVFDEQLVERYGRDVQRSRVQREKELVGQLHPNLVRILDAGEEAAGGLLYVAMELFNGSNLAQRLEDVPMASIAGLISQVASAAAFLSGLGLVHRDIKPENIGVSDDFSRAVLLDLGVVRPKALSKITDESGKQFVGTLQYAPPELLLREEGVTPEAWDAITFYQLGAVLHDLIAKRPLFEDYAEPYARLVKAVCEVPVRVLPAAAETPRDLVALAQNCLVKDPTTRLKLVSWKSFEDGSSRAEMVRARERIAARRAREEPPPTPANYQKIAIKELVLLVDAALHALPYDGEFPSVTVEHRTIPGFSAAAELKTSAGLGVVLWILVGLNVEAGPDSVVTVKAASYVGEQRPAEAPPDVWREVFSGVRQDDAIRSGLAETAVLSLDLAQYAAENDPERTRLGAWLPGEQGGT